MCVKAAFATLLCHHIGHSNIFVYKLAVIKYIYMSAGASWELVQSEFFFDEIKYQV